jgi:ribosomal-protein-alanine N-acetyltransferase
VSAVRTDPTASDAAAGPPAPVVTITPMRRRHLRRVISIESQAVHQGWSVGLYLAELRRESGRLYIVAKVGGEVVGHAGLLLVGDDAHVTTMGVDEAHQGRRIGTRLMLVLARQAIKLGLTNMTLEVRASNEPAIALYRRFGLAPAGIRKNYYADIGEDALVMWANDIDQPAYAARLDAVEAGLDGATILEGLDP